ncbi:MAG TPA: hypothetical protein VH458_21135 [Vicinamibacterales bacterium]|jgi:glycogen operon protein
MPLQHRTTRTVTKGCPYPLGATLTSDGVNFAYGYKVQGPFQPEQGLRFNDAKLLLDPYARAVTAKFRNTDNLLLAYDSSAASRDLSVDARDNSRIVPKAIIIDDTAFDWQGDRSPDLELEQLFIYEVHLKAVLALRDAADEESRLRAAVRLGHADAPRRR